MRMTFCGQCDTENPDVAKFCLACGSPLVAAPPKQEFRKVVTIVFSDLKGSTAMGEKLDSESLREVMTRGARGRRHATRAGRAERRARASLGVSG